MTARQSEMFDKPRIHTELPGHGYAATPGSGPDGETCGGCGNCKRFDKGKTKFNKCIVIKRRSFAEIAAEGMRRGRSVTFRGWSRATDIRLDAPACLHWRKSDVRNDQESDEGGGRDRCDAG